VTPSGLQQPQQLQSLPQQLQLLAASPQQQQQQQQQGTPQVYGMQGGYYYTSYN